MSRPRKHAHSKGDKRYGRCRSCRFWVTPEERHCANCGLAAPHPSRANSARGLAEGFVGGGALLIGMGSLVGFPQETFATLFLFGGCVGAPIGCVVDGYLTDQRRKVDCLQSYERTIKLRLREIDGVLGRIETIRGRLGATPGPELQRVAEVLHSAEQAYPQHRDRYQLKLLEIDLVRWQNALEPLGHAAEGLTFEQCERRLDDLAVLQERGDALAEQWRGARLGSAATQVMRVRLDRGLALCEQIRQSLITRQALTVVSGVQVLRTDAALSASATVESGLDLMTARAELGEFVQGLSALEAEHARLEAELEVNRLGSG